MILYCIFIFDRFDGRYENAAQLIGIVLSNHRFLERLDVLDVQTFILEIVARVDHHLHNQLSLDVSPFLYRVDSRNDFKVIFGSLGVKSAVGGRIKQHSTLKTCANGYMK